VVGPARQARDALRLAEEPEDLGGDDDRVLARGRVEAREVTLRTHLVDEGSDAVELREGGLEVVFGAARLVVPPREGHHVDLDAERLLHAPYGPRRRRLRRRGEVALRAGRRL